MKYTVLAGIGDHHQGGTGDCPPTFSPTSVTLGTSAREGGGGASQEPCCRRRAQAPASHQGSQRNRNGTARHSWYWSSVSSTLHAGRCCLLSPASVKISSVINYLRAFWSKNSFTTLSTTLKFTLLELHCLLFLFPVKNLYVLFLLIARDLVGI